MHARYAFVTLLTSDAYLPGALTVAAALNDVHRSLPSDQTVEYETVCLVTPETVGVTSIRLLRKAFDIVVGVEVIVPHDPESLTLLGRLDLDTALTKLHVFRLTQYFKVIFLDADVLPLRPLSHLFHLDHEFSAVPDVGWPDIFNSGMMVLSPGEDKFKELRELLITRGTWDGADQGLLNEWRGNNWNRLSFTYNTTPTAIYTYAPAYQRFGSQISVVHFIGPQKPWHSIPYRAPGSSAQPVNMATETSIETSATQKRAYDYGSLVDRWYSVYDHHCRSQATEPVFQHSKYTSAWNGGDIRHVTIASGALGLDELRRAALEGMEASGISAHRTYGEGAYQTMPLEGRFDLIRPRTRTEKRQAEAEAKDSSETSRSTLDPPEPSTATPEPSTPPGQVLSLPSGSPVRWTTLPTPGIHEIPSAPYTRLISLPPTPLRYVPAPYKPLRDTREAGAQTVLIQSPRREPGGTDMPLTPLMWNSAIKTPPNVTTPAPTDTYFPKVWDMDQNWSSISTPSSDTSLTTMETGPYKPKPPPNVISSPSLVHATPPILRHRGRRRNSIREENESPTPDPIQVKRVFPWEERPRRVPGRVFPDERSPMAPHHPATPERKATFRSPMPSPLLGFPPSLQPHYPSDSSLLQRHASGAPWIVPSPSPLGLENRLGRVETGSQDGDVEDEVDSEEEAIMRSRMRGSGFGMVKGAPKYRSIGVQTDPRDLREEGIQVTTFVPVTEVAEKLILMNKRLRRNWLASTGTGPSAVAATYVSSSSPSSPALGSLTTPASYEARDPSPSSVDSSITQLSPAGSSPLARTRKGSRVWDPSRDIEAFKRGSEEVLAKFMKTGSLEEHA